MTLADITVTVPEKLYVGVQGRKAFCTDTYPLAFATPWGSDKAFEKRQSTVDNWVGEQRQAYLLDSRGQPVKEDVVGERYDYSTRTSIPYTYQRHVMAPIIPDEYEAQIIDNTPLEGFFFDKSVTRWRTQNKWFAINDPRGFQLQISAENLGDILINNGVVNGDLQGKYVWARSGGKVYLIGETNPAYQKAVNPEVTRKALLPGDRVGNEVFVGKVFIQAFKKVHRYVRNSTGEIMPDDYRHSHSFSYQYNNSNPDHHSNFDYHYFVVEEKDTKPYFLFQLDGGTYNLRRSRPKGPTSAENQPFVMPDNSTLRRIDHWGSMSAAFNTKAELLASTHTVADGIEAIYRKDVEENRKYNQQSEPTRLTAIPEDNIYVAPITTATV